MIADKGDAVRCSPRPNRPSGVPVPWWWANGGGRPTPPHQVLAWLPRLTGHALLSSPVCAEGGVCDAIHVGVDYAAERGLHLRGPSDVGGMNEYPSARRPHQAGTG